MTDQFNQPSEMSIPNAHSLFRDATGNRESTVNTGFDRSHPLAGKDSDRERFNRHGYWLQSFPEGYSFPVGTGKPGTIAEVWEGSGTVLHSRLGTAQMPSDEHGLATRNRPIRHVQPLDQL